MTNFKNPKGEIFYRFVENSYADGQCYFQVVGETNRKFILKWVFGEGPNPYWGREVKIFKNQVRNMIKGRDEIQKIIPLRYSSFGIKF